MRVDRWRSFEPDIQVQDDNGNVYVLRRPPSRASLVTAQRHGTQHP